MNSTHWPLSTTPPPSSATLAAVNTTTDFNCPDVLNQVFYGICNFSGFILNILLFYTIVRYSTPPLRPYLPVLLATCTIDGLSSFFQFITQARPGVIGPNYLLTFSMDGVLPRLVSEWSIFEGGNLNYLLVPEYIGCYFSVTFCCVPFIFRYFLICWNHKMAIWELMIPSTLLFALAAFCSVTINYCAAGVYEINMKLVPIPNPNCIRFLPQFSGGQVSNHLYYIFSLWGDGVIAILLTYLITVFCAVSIHIHLWRHANESNIHRSIQWQLSFTLALQAFVPLLAFYGPSVAAMVLEAAGVKSSATYLVTFASYALVPVLNVLIELFLIQSYRNAFLGYLGICIPPLRQKFKRQSLNMSIRCDCVFAAIHRRAESEDGDRICAEGSAGDDERAAENAVCPVAEFFSFLLVSETFAFIVGFYPPNNPTKDFSTPSGAADGSTSSLWVSGMVAFDMRRIISIAVIQWVLIITEAAPPSPPPSAPSAPSPSSAIPSAPTMPMGSPSPPAPSFAPLPRPEVPHGPPAPPDSPTTIPPLPLSTQRPTVPLPMGPPSPPPSPQPSLSPPFSHHSPEETTFQRREGADRETDGPVRTDLVRTGGGHPPKPNPLPSDPNGAGALSGPIPHEVHRVILPVRPPGFILEPGQTFESTIPMPPIHDGEPVPSIRPFQPPDFRGSMGRGRVETVAPNIRPHAGVFGPPRSPMDSRGHSTNNQGTGDPRNEGRGFPMDPRGFPVDPRGGFRGSISQIDHRGFPTEHRSFGDRENNREPLDNRVSPLDNRVSPLDPRGSPFDNRGSPVDTGVDGPIKPDGGEFTFIPPETPAIPEGEETNQLDGRPSEDPTAGRPPGRGPTNPPPGKNLITGEGWNITDAQNAGLINGEDLDASTAGKCVICGPKNDFSGEEEDPLKAQKPNAKPRGSAWPNDGPPSSSPIGSPSSLHKWPSDGAPYFRPRLPVRPMGPSRRGGALRSPLEGPYDPSAEPLPRPSGGRDSPPGLRPRSSLEFSAEHDNHRYGRISHEATQSIIRTCATKLDCREEPFGARQKRNDVHRSELNVQRRYSPHLTESAVQRRLDKIQAVKLMMLNAAGLAGQVNPTNDGTFEHDILLTEDQAEILMHKLHSVRRQKRSAIYMEQLPSQLWDRGEPIPFTFDSSLTERDRLIVRQALNAIESATCIRFEFQPQKPDINHIFYVKIATPTFCGLSYIGKISPANPIYLSFACGDAVGVAIHETMHALGVNHEHLRVDRDKYLQMEWDNINPQYFDYFAIADPLSFTSYGVPFDFESIMLYGPFTGAVDPNRPSLRPVDDDGTKFAKMGQRKRLSPQDIELLNRMYCKAPDCVDRNVFCGTWSLRGLCFGAQQSSWMNRHCRRSCNLC